MFLHVWGDGRGQNISWSPRGETNGSGELEFLVDVLGM